MLKEKTKNNQEYFELLNDIKNQIKLSRIKTTITVNTEMILMYYKVGTMILERNVWGSKFIENLSKDLRLAFPNREGFSTTNLRYMQKFASVYKESEIFPQGVGELSWRSNRMLLDRLKTKEERLWYAKKAIENNWSSIVLDHQIGTKLIGRQADNAKKISNYLEVIEDPQNERVLNMLKDPYFIDYVEYKEDLIENQIEDAMIAQITKLLLELGKGFCFKGNQYHLQIGQEDFYLDMLFFNTELNCYVVIELKNEKFKPEFAGQLGFYVQAVNEKLRKDHNLTIGILLCRGKDTESVKLSLASINVPVGVAEYKFMNEMPDYLENVIPSIESLEARLDN